MVTRFRQLIPAFGLWIAISLSGADPAARLVRFRVFSPDPEPAITFSPSLEARARRLDFFPTEVSGTCTYRGTMPLVFRDEAGTEIASVTLPEESNDVLLLFLRHGADQHRQTIFVIDSSERTRPAGSLSIVNFSGLKLTGTYRGHVLALKVGLNPSLLGSRSAALVLRTVVNGRSYQAFSDNISVDPSERKLLLLLQPFTPGGIEPQWRLLSI